MTNEEIRSRCLQQINMISHTFAVLCYTNNCGCVQYLHDKHVHAVDSGNTDFDVWLMLSEVGTSVNRCVFGREQVLRLL